MVFKRNFFQNKTQILYFLFSSTPELMIMPFLKGDVLITTTTQMIVTTTTTTTIPSTTRPIPTFTPNPITSAPTTTSQMPLVTSTVAKTTQITSSRTMYSTETFLKGSKILILNSRNFHKSMTINEKNHFQNANITFELGTQAYKACSGWFSLLDLVHGSMDFCLPAYAKMKTDKSHI